jgi:hypothetical protein
MNRNRVRAIIRRRSTIHNVFLAIMVLRMTLRILRIC